MKYSIFGVEIRINLRNFQRKIEKKLREKLREIFRTFREKFREILDFLDHPLKIRNIQQFFKVGPNQNYSRKIKGNFRIFGRRFEN